jgi:hypothetical protein
MIGCNQPQQDPADRSLATDICRVDLKQFRHGRARPMDKDKLIKQIGDLLPRATLKQLRLLYMVAFEIVRKV